MDLTPVDIVGKRCYQFIHAEDVEGIRQSHLDCECSNGFVQWTNWPLKQQSPKQFSDVNLLELKELKSSTCPLWTILQQLFFYILLWKLRALRKALLSSTFEKFPHSSNSTILLPLSEGIIHSASPTHTHTEAEVLCPCLVAVWMICGVLFAAAVRSLLWC